MSSVGTRAIVMNDVSAVQMLHVPAPQNLARQMFFNDLAPGRDAKNQGGFFSSGRLLGSHWDIGN